eukprot:1345044-Prorocentrum_lima.AAC.1
MTSSLVGSEMCIRDSLANEKALDAIAVGLQQPLLLRLPREVITHGPFPVSYTHLTLPTICSV